MHHNNTTTFGISVMDEARLTSTLDDGQVAQLELALECYLQEEVGKIRPCSRMQWLQVEGPAVRPAMVVRPHAPERFRVLWARQNGGLYDLVVSAGAVRDLGWIVLQHMPEGVTAAGLAGAPVVSVTKGQTDRLVFAALGGANTLGEP